MKSDVVSIGNTEMLVKEYNGQRVVTFKDIDTVHQNAKDTAKRNFNRNKKRFVEGEDYILLTRDKLKRDKIVPLNVNVPTRGITLLTESGYLMIVKSLTDDLAWQVQRQLVNTYFKAREQQLEKVDSTFDVEKYHNINDTTTTPAPRNVSWYSRNVYKFDDVCTFLDCDFRYLIGRIMFALRKEFDIDRACLIYELEKGTEPRYILDVVGYFPELSERAEKIIDTLYDASLRYGTLANFKAECKKYNLMD